MERHLIFVNAFNFIWTLFLANSYFMMAYFMKSIEALEDMGVSEFVIPTETSPEYLKSAAKDLLNIEDAFVFLVMLQGPILAFFRFREPVYYYMVEIEMKSWFGKESREQ